MLKTRPDIVDLLGSLIESGKVRSTAELSPGEPITIVVGPDHGGVVGSVKVDCACGGYGWLSPSTQDVLKTNPEATILCYQCMKKLIAKT
jgi:hypothetical protein